MELWIRSQDKENLVKINEVYIEEILDTTVFITNKYNIGEWSIQCNDTILGVYKTKKRALEVLDEIQTHIKRIGQGYIETDKSGIPCNVKYYGNIYEMPKDEEE